MQADVKGYLTYAFLEYGDATHASGLTYAFSNLVDRVGRTHRQVALGTA
jgi:hypothetical protein